MAGKNKGKWEKGDVTFEKIVYKGKTVKSAEELRKIKAEEAKSKKK